MMPYFEDGATAIYHGDCRDVLDSLYSEGGERFDHLITDPPYSAHVHSKSMRGANGWKGEISETRVLGFEPLSPELLAWCGVWFGVNVERWVLVFSDTESAHLWREAIPADYVRTLFWRKTGGAPQFTGDRPAVACEAITACHRPGRKRWNGGGKHGFYDVPIVLDHGPNCEARVHTTQKPEALMSQLVADFTDAGELILDPFMGSGTTLVAAKRLGRRAIGIEKDERYCEIAANRLRQGALKLFGAADAVDRSGGNSTDRPRAGDLLSSP
jgi:DNA modification methylase